MRRAGIIIGIVIVLIVAAIAVFAATFNVNRYRGTIQSDLQKRLGREVTLGEMHLRLIPPRFVVHNAAVADDPGFHTGRPFLQASEVDISLKLLPLLHKSVEIDSLYFERPAVELIKDQQGVWNFASLGGPAKSSSGREQFSLGKFVIQDGLIAETDQQAHQPRSVYDHIDLTLRNLVPGQPFSVDASARLPGSNNQQMTLQGTGGPVRQDQWMDTPFQGNFVLQQVRISAIRQFLNSPALARIDGALSGHARLDSHAGNLSADGNVNLENARLNGRPLGYPITVRYNLRDDLPADILTISGATIQLGSTPFTVNGTVNSKTAPSRIDLSAKANNVSIAESAKLAAAAGVALTPGAAVSGTVDADVRATGAANDPALNGTVHARNVQVSGKEFPLPVQVNSVTLELTPSEIHSDAFTVTSGATAMTVQFGLRQYLSKNLVIDASLRSTNAELPALLSMAKAYGIQALDKVSGSGTLNLDLHAAGPVRSLASAGLARDLNGTVALNFHDVRYTGADISHEFTAIAGALGLHQSNQGFTSINRMTGDIAIRNGVAQTANTEALLDIGNVGIAGTANLVDQALHLRVTAVLSKELSQTVGGINIGGYAKTVLANSQGELVIPAVVTGTFQHPQFAPDVQQIAQMRLKGLVPNFNNPGAAVSGLLGNLLNGRPGNGAQNQNGSANRSANPLQQLEGLFGKKQK